MERTRMQVWNWLVANGLYRDLESAFILVPIMRFMGSRFAKDIGNAVKRGAHDVERDVRKDIDHVS